MDLNSLPRKLAERAADELWNDLSDFQREIAEREREAEYAGFIAAAREPIEAVIREAIDKALQSSIAKLQALTESEMPSDRLIGIQTAIELLQEDSCRANGKT